MCTTVDYFKWTQETERIADKERNETGVPRDRCDAEEESHSQKLAAQSR